MHKDSVVRFPHLVHSTLRDLLDFFPREGTGPIIFWISDGLEHVLFALPLGVEDWPYLVVNKDRIDVYDLVPYERFERPLDTHDLCFCVFRCHVASIPTVSSWWYCIVVVDEHKNPKVHSLDEVRRKRAQSSSRLSEEESVCYHPFEMDDGLVTVDEHGVSVFLNEAVGGVYLDVDSAEMLGLALIQAAHEKRLVDEGILKSPESA